MLIGIFIGLFAGVNIGLMIMALFIGKKADK